MAANQDAQARLYVNVGVPQQDQNPTGSRDAQVRMLVWVGDFASRLSVLPAQVPMVVDPATVEARNSVLPAQVPMTVDPTTVSARLSTTVLQVVLVPNYNVRLLASGYEVIVWDGAIPRVVKALH